MSVIGMTCSQKLNVAEIVDLNPFMLLRLGKVAILLTRMPSLRTPSVSFLATDRISEKYEK